MPEFDRTAFAQRLSTLIENPKTAPSLLAPTVGAHRNRIAEWLRGTRTPSVPHAVALAAALEVDLDWLLTGRGQTPTPRIAQKTAPEVAAIAAQVQAIAPQLAELAERARDLPG